MRIKKYQAASETEAMLKIKEELGKDAVIINIKTITPKGLQKFFKKPSVEVTAAVDEQDYQRVEQRRITPQETTSFVINNESQNTETAETLDKKLSSLQALLERQMNQPPEIKEEENLNQPVIQLLYEQLIENEVDEKIANQLLHDIEMNTKKEIDMSQLLAMVYSQILKGLDVTRPIQLANGSPKVIMFVGPTGVGKTTTIAKLASVLKLKQYKKVAMITADTYRIAAIEQLRTYANILNIPLQAVYQPDELMEAIYNFNEYDLILIDTAGHSYKNEAQWNEMEKLVEMVEEKEVYLVLSAATKYKDLLHIATKYQKVANYHLIFTKLDETNCLGNIFNIKMATGAALSYITSGQNVPDDISEVDIQMIAKHLLGGNK